MVTECAGGTSLLTIGQSRSRSAVDDVVIASKGSRVVDNESPVGTADDISESPERVQVRSVVSFNCRCWSGSPPCGDRSLQDLDGLVVLQHDLNVKVEERGEDWRPASKNRRVVGLDQPESSVPVHTFDPHVNRLALRRRIGLQNLENPLIPRLIDALPARPREMEKHVISSLM